ncbi:MAG: hypothetical protein ABWY04_18325 [Arthrobacter sp.]
MHAACRGACPAASRRACAVHPKRSSRARGEAAKAVEDGNAVKAAQALKRFVDFLGQQKGRDKVSDTARTSLPYNAENILRAFGG